MRNDDRLFFTCSLIEFIGRQQKQRRSQVISSLGKKVIERIYNYADVFHCEPIEKVADDFIVRYNVPVDTYDNVAKCRYEVPDYWAIGEVYERLIEDIIEDTGNNIIDCLVEIYSSWISDVISNYNSDFYYQSREYICQCYKEGKVCA